MDFCQTNESTHPFKLQSEKAIVRQRKQSLLSTISAPARCFLLKLQLMYILKKFSPHMLRKRRTRIYHHTTAHYRTIRTQVLNRPQIQKKKFQKIALRKMGCMSSKPTRAYYDGEDSSNAAARRPIHNRNYRGVSSKPTRAYYPREDRSNAAVRRPINDSRYPEVPSKPTRSYNPKKGRSNAAVRRQIDDRKYPGGRRQAHDFSRDPARYDAAYDKKCDPRYDAAYQTLTARSRQGGSGITSSRVNGLAGQWEGDNVVY